MKEMIHKYVQNGQYIVLDVCSGGVHVVDELTYKLLDYVAPPFADVCPDEIIAKMDGFDKDDVKECYAELKELYDAKMLFTEDDYEQYAAMAMKAPIKAMCLHVSHDCNLRCKYCFAQTGDFGGDRMLMKPETGKRAMDFLIKHSANRENLEVDFFFGSGPLSGFLGFGGFRLAVLGLGRLGRFRGSGGRVGFLCGARAARKHCREHQHCKDQRKILFHVHSSC